MTKRLFVVIVALLGLFLVGFHRVSAQTTPGPQVLGVVSEPGAEALGLHVYFVVTDAQGRPILGPQPGGCHHPGARRRQCAGAGQRGRSTEQRALSFC